MAATPAYDYGDRLRLEGDIRPPAPFDGFDYPAHLARKDILCLMEQPDVERLASGRGSPFWAALYGLKDRARLALARMIPEPEASLLQGIVLGLKAGIPKRLYEEYNATGTSHIIVISGSNISLVARLFALGFGQLLGKRRAYWLTLAGIALYVLLVGADAAVIRAGLMGGLYVTARHLGRLATAHVSLAASAVLLTFVEPLALWDAGFQLSFAATLSLILFSPPLEALVERGLARLTSSGKATSGILRFLNEALVTTLAAQVLTLPVVAYHFGRLSLVSPLANLLILPVQPPIMALGGLAALTGTVPILEPLARVVAWLPWLCLDYTGAVVRALAAWPLASLDLGHLGWQWPALYYTFLAAGAWAVSARRHQPAPGAALGAALQRHGRAILALALAAAVLCGLALAQLPDGRLHVAVLDVGQGDAILITTPTGRQILVDGGPSPAALGAALAREMPFWDRSLDLLILTHPDEDHVAGLVEALARFRVGGWLDNGRASDESLYLQCLAVLEAEGVPRHVVAAGDRLDMEQGIVLQVLHPPRGPLPAAIDGDNDASVVLRLTWGEADFLLTGDAGAAAEARLLASGQPLGADVLKVAHHGSGSSTGRAFLEAVGPLFAVISVGIDNNFEHPDSALLERLGEVPDLAVLRTDQAGTVEFVTDGARLWVQTQKR